MKKSLATRRYSKSFFEFSKEKKSIEQVVQDFLRIADLIAESSEFAAFLMNPVISIADRKKVFLKIFDNRAHKDTVTLLLFLADKEKTPQLGEICAALENLYNCEKRILEIKVISKIKLTKAQEQSLCEKLKKFYKKEIKPAFMIDSAMLGGLKIEVGDCVYDLTVSAQLDRFRKSVMAV